MMDKIVCEGKEMPKNEYCQIDIVFIFQYFFECLLLKPKKNLNFLNLKIIFLSMITKKFKQK